MATSRSFATDFLSSAIGRVLTAVLIVAAMVVAAFGAGAFGGTPVDEAAGGWLGADSTWIAPATSAFRIWSVIYLGLIAYAAWQFFRATQTPRHQRVRLWVLAGVILNSVWLFTVQAGWLAVSVLVILTLTACLARCLVLLDEEPIGSWLERILLDGVQGLSLGWVSIATIANVAGWLGSLGWQGSPLTEESWAITMAVLATALGLALAWRFGRLTPGLAIAWGLAWVAVGRTDGSGPQSVPVAVATAVAAAIILAGSLAGVLRRRRARSS
ncbi:tryptophan-rich sensory protein [Parenemella sanctibonifatiensis]|uniref:Tryptophan-rich sensory protein n=1 Tax=Parenemella sanctibonifatiensis TaxID=2016505 RepID=A0A255EGR7_9ACTN|nr:tryptophan-rich sensory protein [Parenemella sanctibonifatiensis]OYN90734.1 hypothetical protein CGZ92_00885 [Parenemella sanctibonifatiensis]